jgi:hypothetical protein
MAFRRVHARDHHTPMHYCVRDHERVLHAMKRAFAVRHGVQELHPARNLLLRVQLLGRCWAEWRGLTS